MKTDEVIKTVYALLNRCDTGEEAYQAIRSSIKVIEAHCPFIELEKDRRARFTDDVLHGKG